MMGLIGKPKLCTKFEVDSLCHCKKNKGEPHILGSSLSQMPCPLFFWVRFFDGLWQPPSACQFSVAAFSRCRNAEGEPRNLYFYRKLHLTMDNFELLVDI